MSYVQHTCVSIKCDDCGTTYDFEDSTIHFETRVEADKAVTDDPDYSSRKGPTDGTDPESSWTVEPDPDYTVAGAWPKHVEHDATKHRCARCRCKRKGHPLTETLRSGDRYCPCGEKFQKAAS